MKNSILILISFILILFIGLTYNLFQANDKIDKSFYINKQLDNLSLINDKIDLAINTVVYMNYDHIDKLIADMYEIVKNIENDMNDNSIEYRDILNNLSSFKKKFDYKVSLINRFRSVNSLLNNSYRNSLKLKDVIDNEITDKSDIKIVNRVMEEMLSFSVAKIPYSVKKLSDITKNKYKSSNMNSFLANINIYKSNFSKLQKIRDDIKDINIQYSLDTFTSSYIRYSKSIIYNIKTIIVAFIITLVGFFILLYMLIYRLGQTNRLLNAKTDDLEKSLLTINQNVMYSKSDLNGVMTDVSDAFCRISGYSRDELVGKNYSFLKSGDMDKNIFVDLWTTIKNNKKWIGEIQNKRKDGSIYWLRTTITPIFDNDNIKIGYSSILYDISDRIMVEKLNSTLEDRVKIEVDKNREKVQHMLHQSRLAQMGEMISVIAHQWRQPLAAISSTSTSLIIKTKLKKLDDETIVRLAGKISEYSSHLSSTIDDFRDFFKSNKELKETNYNELTDSVLSIVEDSLINKNIKIVKHLHSKEVLYTYPNEIKQVILNLMKNAEDALLDNNIENPTIAISTDGYIFRVEDNGGGISLDIIDKIFDPYFSTKTQKDGTGLGLYMSKTIIERNCGGKLNVYNGTDGAIFEIILKGECNDDR